MNRSARSQKTPTQQKNNNSSHLIWRWDYQWNSWQEYAMTPFTISPYCRFGSIINHFLYGPQPSPLPIFDDKTWLNARCDVELSISTKVPSRILPRVNDLWRITCLGEDFGNSYKSINPVTFAEQKFGQLICIANGSHILRGMSSCGMLKLKIKNEQWPWWFGYWCSQLFVHFHLLTAIYKWILQNILIE